VFLLLQFQFKGTNILTSVPAGVQLTLVSATLPTSVPDILGSIIEVHLIEINKVAFGHVLLLSYATVTETNCCVVQYKVL
jgi:hypothetical protein